MCYVRATHRGQPTNNHHNNHTKKRTATATTPPSPRALPSFGHRNKSFVLGLGPAPGELVAGRHGLAQRPITAWLAVLVIGAALGPVRPQLRRRVGLHLRRHLPKRGMTHGCDGASRAGARRGGGAVRGEVLVVALARPPQPEARRRHGRPALLRRQQQ